MDLVLRELTTMVKFPIVSFLSRPSVRADDHHPEKFETNWSLGVSGYERTCGTLTWATQTYEWLNVVAGTGGGPVHFVMSVGGHAIRFFRGSPDDVPERYRQTSFPEFLELQRALELDGTLPVGRSLRIAIENDAEGRPGIDLPCRDQRRYRLDDEQLLDSCHEHRHGYHFQSAERAAREHSSCIGGTYSGRG